MSEKAVAIHILQEKLDECREMNEKQRELIHALINCTPTLRDQFAMAALQGILTVAHELNRHDFKSIAEQCYLQADAMLKAREE